MYICFMNQQELLKGTLSTIVLTLLRERGRMYGYEITRAVKERTEGKILLKEGSLYPALHKLLNEGLVYTEEEMAGKRMRIYYRLTSTGEERVKIRVNELISFLNTIQQLVLQDKPLVHG